MRKVSVGDLCLVVGGNPKNYMKTVLVESCDPEDRLGHIWEVSRPTPDLEVFCGGVKRTSRNMWTKPDSLLPITPDSTETIHTEQEVTA